MQATIDWSSFWNGITRYLWKIFFLRFQKSSWNYNCTNQSLFNWRSGVDSVACINRPVFFGLWNFRFALRKWIHISFEPKYGNPTLKPKKKMNVFNSSSLVSPQSLIYSLVLFKSHKRTFQPWKGQFLVYFQRATMGHGSKLGSHIIVSMYW